MQIEHTGHVSRICLTTNDASSFLPSDNAIPSDDRGTAEPTAPDSMLMLLDQECESEPLCNTLRGVTIAILSPEPEKQADLVWAARELRAQMPATLQRQRLSFQVSRQSMKKLKEIDLLNTALENVFEYENSYWDYLELDD